VPRFVTSCLLGEPVTVHGDGSAARDWIFVEEHCEALDLLLHIDIEKIRGQVINIGSEEHRSVREVAEAVVEAMKPERSRIVFIGDRPGQVFRHTADTNRLRQLTGWKPKLNFNEALQRTIRWYCDNESWWRSQMWMRHIPIITAAGKKEMH
jgi:dTDP-glucose 4,6-dehydratase